jgi:His/Glu/Gln/Arg/opine family amino acid ABC transporter permease subunit
MSDFGFEPVLRLSDVLFRGALATLGLAVGGMVIAMLIGTVSAALASSPLRAARGVARVYVDLFRGTPLLIQLLLLFYFAPTVGLKIPALVAGLIGLGLYYGAYISEILRGALASIPRGHLDAAEALGLSKFRTFRRIVLPQALVIALPPLSSQFMALVKGTSLLSVITIFELTTVGHEVSVRTSAPVETWITVAAMYLLLNGTAALLSSRTEAAVRRRYA